jgi:NAD(P)-dependent dehydrogenase (short-subunit alcohol dehydrogenase family)
METLPPPLQEAWISNAALKRLAEPEDLLGTLEFLCSDASAYITGQTLVVDGGIYTLG